MMGPSNHSSHSIAEWGEDLERGQSKRGMCPFCQAKHEPDSFVLRRDAYQPWRLWFRCYRAKCGQQGVVKNQDGIRMYLYAPAANSSNEENLKAEYDLGQPLARGLVSELVSRYPSLHPWAVTRQGWRYNPFENSLLIPWRIWDFHAEHYEIIGWIERGLNGFKHSMKWNPSPTSQLCWTTDPYTTLREAKHVVITEDPISALCISSVGQEFKPRKHVRTAFLQGHNLRAGDSQMLAHFNFPMVTVVLDPDVWPKASVAALRELRALGVQCRTTVLSDDPKAVPVKELHGFVRDL